MFLSLLHLPEVSLLTLPTPMIPNHSLFHPHALPVFLAHQRKEEPFNIRWYCFTTPQTTAVLVSFIPSFYLQPPGPCSWGSGAGLSAVSPAVLLTGYISFLTGMLSTPE